MPPGAVIRGEAGIGKTALWRTAVELAETAGVTVLVTRCAEAEMPLALGGVGDLIETALAEVAGELAEPQRRRSPLLSVTSCRRTRHLSRPRCRAPSWPTYAHSQVARLCW